MTATGYQGDLDSRSVGPVEGFEVGGGYLELGVEQGSVDVDRDESNRHFFIVI